MCKFNYIFIVLIFGLLTELSAQDNVYENKITQMRASVLKIQNQTSSTSKVKKGIGNGLLNIYQKHISILISADCLYALSCSRYSREVVNSRGLFLGILLSADRLTRCTAICAKDIPNSKFNSEGFVEDLP